MRPPQEGRRGQGATQNVCRLARYRRSEDREALGGRPGRGPEVETLRVVEFAAAGLPSDAHQVRRSWPELRRDQERRPVMKEPGETVSIPPVNRGRVDQSHPVDPPSCRFRERKGGNGHGGRHVGDFLAPELRPRA